MEVKEQMTINEYKRMLQTEKGDAVNTMKTKLSHIKTWLKQSYSVNVHIKFFRGEVELRH